MLLLLFIELWNFFLSSTNVIGWLRIRKYNLLFTSSNGPPTLWSEESREIKSRLDGEARKCNDDNSQPPHCVNFEIQRKHCAGTASFFFFFVGNDEDDRQNLERRQSELNDIYAVTVCNQCISRWEMLLYNIVIHKGDFWVSQRFFDGIIWDRKD